MIKMTVNGWLLLAVTSLALPAYAGESAFGREPLFVGAPPPSAFLEAFTAGTDYMTAAEMQAKVISLTGFSHPAFDDYADILGRFDPKSGQRTNAQPSLMGVLVLQQIMGSVASYVVEREVFLSDSERLVFPKVELDHTPSDEVLAKTLSDLHERWLRMPAGPQTLNVLQAEFRHAETANGVQAGYTAALALLLQHGALYYY